MLNDLSTRILVCYMWILQRTQKWGECSKYFPSHWARWLHRHFLWVMSLSLTADSFHFSGARPHSESRVLGLRQTKCMSDYIITSHIQIRLASSTGKKSESVWRKPTWRHLSANLLFKTIFRVTVYPKWNMDSSFTRPHVKPVRLSFFCRTHTQKNILRRTLVTKHRLPVYGRIWSFCSLKKSQNVHCKENITM